jgi:toxin ParE1/3/4
MKVVIREKAARDLEEIFEWIARESPRAAARIVRHLRDRIARLGTLGLEHTGRPGFIEGTRELVEPPHIIVYRVDEDREEVIVLAVFHGAQNIPRGSP